MPEATERTLTARAERLFTLLERLAPGGDRCVRMSEIDRAVDQGRPALILKHDVHGVPVRALLAFAERERKTGHVGTYFFMSPDHPLTTPAFDFSGQVEAMRAVAAMGHELGAHLDPYFLMEHHGRPWRDVLTEVLDRFAEAGVPVSCGNMHGHSRFKMPDRHGYGTSFDLFEEIGRQQDFPALADVPPEVAERIRTNRVRLVDHGLTHWADMPLWSARHGFVVTNFITDNQLGKRGTVEALVHPETIDHYKLSAVQPPGSRTPSPTRRLVPCPVPDAPPPPDAGSVTLAFDEDELDVLVHRLASHPTLVLIHPELYCV